MSPGSGADAPAPTTTLGQPWDREGKVGAPAPAQVATPVAPPSNRGSLTRDELKRYHEFSQGNVLARLDAENFEMEMRRDFAERRLKRLQGA
jgi:hypothetical protein